MVYCALNIIVCANQLLIRHPAQAVELLDVGHQYPGMRCKSSLNGSSVVGIQYYYVDYLCFTLLFLSLATGDEKTKIFPW